MSRKRQDTNLKMPQFITIHFTKFRNSENVTKMPQFDQEIKSYKTWKYQ